MLPVPLGSYIHGTIEYLLQFRFNTFKCAFFSQIRWLVLWNRCYGRIGEDFEQWIKEFERCARAHHWGDERCAEILPSLLRDRAANIWEEMPEIVQRDFEKTKELSTEYFFPRDIHVYNVF